MHQHVRQLSAGKLLSQQPQYQTSTEFESQVRKEAEHERSSERGGGYERFLEGLKYAGMSGEGSSGSGRGYIGTVEGAGANGGMAAAVGEMTDF